jgi:dipeptidyl aminopeptidase/acylaminoacyl peptidase
MSLFSSAKRLRPALTVALLGLAGLGIGLAPASLGAAPKRLITEKDLFRFVWIGDPQISPDGRKVVFVRVTVDDKKEGYDTALWIVPTDGGAPARPLTAGPRDSSPRWSPDGARLAFVRSPRESQGSEGGGQIYLLAMDGGEPWRLTDIARGAGSPAWSPDGKTLAFTSNANPGDLAKKKGTAEERESDVRVVTRAVYRMNGAGYLDPTRPGHLWTVAVPAANAAPADMPAARQITSGEFAESKLAWSNDGSRILFTSNRVKEPYYADQDSDLYSVAATGGEIVRVASIEGQIENFTSSPDGRRIAFKGTLNGEPVRSYDEADLFVTDAAAGVSPRNLTADYNYEVDAGITGDQHAPRVDSPRPVVWLRDGRSVIVQTAERGSANLTIVDTETGKRRPLTQGKQEVTSYSATPDGSRLAVVISTPTVIGDLYVLDTATGQRRPLVRPNEELFAELDLTEPEEITYASFDGKPIHAWVQKPPGFEPSKKYPLILNIHGGPHSAYGFTFDHEFQWMAAKGYVVLYPNPRGSSTYGQDFGNIIQYKYPGDDHKDLMAGVDELIKRGYIDDKKLGITGGSGGGILTNWAITQTNRFAAAVAQRSIADWASFWYTADFSQFTPSWFRGAPWEDPKDYAARSPITFADKITTPLMLIEGEADYRTPSTAGGEQMFRALKYLKKPVVMVRFPGESHELSRSGRPWHRVERLEHIVGWFDKYLQGKNVDAYDVP